LLLRIATWLVATLVLFMSAHVLRGRQDFTTTMRVAGFAQSAHILELLRFIPVVGDLARLIAVVLAVIGTWVGTAAAQELKGWRTILLPVLFIIVAIIGSVFMESVIEGAAITIERLLAEFGL